MKILEYDKYGLAVTEPTNLLGFYFDDLERQYNTKELNINSYYTYYKNMSHYVRISHRNILLNLDDKGLVIGMISADKSWKIGDCNERTT